MKEHLITPKDQRKIFFQKILSVTTRDIELRAFPSIGGQRRRILTRDLDTIEKFIEFNKNDLYFGVYTREGGGTKHHVKEVYCFFADIDFKNYPRGEAEAGERLNKFEYKPTFIVHSGNGLHAYWFLRDTLSSFEKIEPILRGIAQVLKSDPAVCELARVMRIPGTFNYKNKDKKECRIIEHNPERLYNLNDFFKYETIAKQSTDKIPLKKIYSGVPEGQRNDSLTRLVGSWVNDRLTFDECLENAHIWNSKNTPPLPKGEVERTVKSIYEKHHRDRQTDTKESDNNDTPYFVDDAGYLCRWKQTKDGHVPVRLANFRAEIAAENIEDDGLELIHNYLIEGKIKNGSSGK